MNEHIDLTGTIFTWTHLAGYGVEVSSGSTCGDLEYLITLPLGTCTPIGANEAVYPMHIVAGGASMFDMVSGDVMYALDKWDPSSNTVYIFSLHVNEHEAGCRVNEYDNTLFAESYCQQGYFFKIRCYCIHIRD